MRTGSSTDSWIMSTLGLGARLKVAVAALVVGAASLASGSADAQCTSPNPNDWPAPAKPYFMIVMDTSGSMGFCLDGSDRRSNNPNCSSSIATDSCGYGKTRADHGRCAIKNTVTAFSEANFGLAGFTAAMDSCPSGACPGVIGDYSWSNCDVDWPNGMCGTGSGSTRSAAHILVPLQQDNFWDASPSPSNVPELLKYVDDQCGDQKELWSDSGTPLNGSLRDMYRYYSNSWTGHGKTLTSPLSAEDRACRSLNVILITDGREEGCDEDKSWQNRAEGAAKQLYDGFDKYGIHWSVTTYVVDFGGSGGAAADNIADYGDDGVKNGSAAAINASDEISLSQALAKVIANAILPENCNNVDDNCNGCVDEGYAHYCNERADCCTAARQTCLTDFALSGNESDLPCVTEAQQTNSSRWLCDNPMELCDGEDNNCDGQIDEGFGDPACCPQTEQCNGVDDDCDGVIDENGTNGPYSLPGCVECQPSAEICDGCDNDCDGLVDEGIAAIDCGFSPPANCAGTQVCAQLANVTEAGACHAGGNSYGSCSSTTATEICDGLDNNCNGQVDELGATPCEIPGKPGLVYKSTNPLSVCELGQQPCNGACVGYRGPSDEICDGLDNDCDGSVDEGGGSLQGVGLDCWHVGSGAAGQCQTAGKTICQGGSIVCSGGDQPGDEICDGLDNDCDGATDEAPLVDAPANPLCWGLPPGNCPADAACQHGNLSWCPPPGAGCKDVGGLAAPCATGTLICNGSSRWFCQGGTVPAPDECDGVDNDCNGTPDDNLVAPVGEACGSDTGTCETGTWICDSGVLDCDGGVTGVQEICDGLNNDCDGPIECETIGNCSGNTDGDVDEGINLGETCTAAYKTADYPGERVGGECTPGTNICDPEQAGGVFCEGGVGPQPEICDGKDNDCDGDVDEAGAAPDGIDGTEDPENPGRFLGDDCGTTEGECSSGTLRCTGGRVDCFGGIGPQAEECDCLDNDCDGETDEDVEPGEDPICSPGKTCVEATADNCQCVGPCSGGEFPCPTGTYCEQDLTKSHSDEPAGPVCVAPNPCGDCKNETHTDSIGRPLCGPPGTELANGQPAPVCKCAGGQCQDPCAGVVCAEGTDCYAGADGVPGCQPEKDCNFFGCVEGKVCHVGACVDDPCDPNPCAEGEVCKPNSDFDEARCVPSCADVNCEDTDVCVDGKCEPSGCEETCAEGNVCKDDGTCGNDCPEERCENGTWCDPADGSCGDHPCEGVRCPPGPPAQECRDGECWEAGGGGDGGGGGGGGAAGAGTGAAAGTDGGAGDHSAIGGGAGAPGDVKGRWGLASGGGGCSTSTSRSNDAGIAFGFALAGLAMVRRRRKRVQDGDASARRAV